MNIEEKRSKWYPWVCMFFLVCCSISSKWSQNIISSMNGYGVEGKDEDPFYAID